MQNSIPSGQRLATANHNMRQLLFLFAVPLVCAASPAVLLSAATESPLEGGVTPPADVVKLILRDEPDDAEQFRACLQQEGIDQKSAAKLFVARAIQLNSDGTTDYFVRPALRPYCGAFYGAHLFRYWLVTGHRQHNKITYQIVFKSGGDEARVLTRKTNGYHDLELIGHTAFTANVNTWRFDGK